MSDLRTLLYRIEQQANASRNDVLSIPPKSYSLESLFNLERERVFTSDWLCVGRIDQVPEVGDFRCLDIVDEPLIMVRGDDSIVRVLSRICRHRSMDIASGNGSASRFICPYHSWTYDLQGNLMAAPHMKHSSQFDLEKTTLPEFSTETWNGFVFVNLDGKAGSLAKRLNGLDQLLSQK